MPAMTGAAHPLSSPGQRPGTGSVSAAWRGEAHLRFARAEGGRTVHQGGATAPLKLLRAQHHRDGRCELPLLHTAGGLVGGDELGLRIRLEPDSRVLLTTVAAQKVYGTVGRSRRTPEGLWARQDVALQLAAGADLEWLPQELVLFAGGLYEQRLRVDLAPGAGFLGVDVVRLGRSAAGEDLGRGRWRCQLEIRRQGAAAPRWELVDRLEIGGDGLAGEHGMAGQPVFGSLVWAAPEPLAEARLAALLDACRRDRDGLAGSMACGPLPQGLVARYRGGSTQAARFWFTRLWARIRAAQGLEPPQLPRVWPFQEDPLAGAVADGARDCVTDRGRAQPDRREGSA